MMAVVLLPTSQVNAAGAHAQITGSGSSWSSNAVNQWVADVTQSGLQVVFTSTGSAQGRKDFTNRTTDFAVSDIGFLGTDSVTGDSDTPCQDPRDTPPAGASCRGYAYLPIVAGGTAFPYQLKVGGKLVRNLRLSGDTLAKIFTGQITNWNDAAISADMNGRKFPSIPIIVVVHSEGSGSTAQFTRYLNKQYPTIWRPFLGREGSTEYFPRKGQMIAQNGSDGVINFITSAAANGAIGYDEYSYALAKNYPVIKLKNASGFYTLPTQYNVAVALTQAQINTDKNSPNYLLQNLDKVYAFGDARTYPMSSYSYMIIPTSANDPRMTTAKRQTLVDYLYYSICQGQAEMGPIGYSPLPVNLVQASFEQTAKLKAADKGVDLTKRDVTTCNNPTFIPGQPKRNHLAEIAPMPAACDKGGAGPCNGPGDSGTSTTPPKPSPTPTPGSTGGSSGGGGSSSGGSSSGSSSSGGSTSGGGSSGGGSTSGGGGSTSGGGTAAGGGGTADGSGGAVNADTGQVDGNGTQNVAAGEVMGTVTEIAPYRENSGAGALAPVVALEIIALVAVPPAVYYFWVRRKSV